MRTAACLFLSTVLAGLACAGNPVTAPAPVDKGALAVDDEPLPPEAPDPPGDRVEPRPRIRIRSASYGANCGRPKGNDTANLAKRCDGRRRCERRLLPKVTGWSVGQGTSLPCLPEYQVKWSCGDKPQRDLRSIPSEEDVSRLRFGCGPEDPARLREAAVPRADAPATSVAKDTVRGRLVTSTGSPVVRATVTIGDSRATTDGDGGFLFHGVPERYDVHLGKTIAYLGLTRRDPVLVCCDGSEPGFWRYHAAITDAVVTDIAPHQGSWARRVVQFLAPKGSNEDRGSYEGQRVVGWRGDNVLTGTFVALIGYGPSDDPWVASYLATERWSLADGDAIAASPTLRKIGSGRIAGTAHLRGPIFPSPNEETLRFRYVVPGLAGSIDLGTCPAKGTYDCRLPDLSELGGEYCMVIGVGDEWADARVSRCGGQLGMRDFSVPAAPPPPVVNHGAKVDADTMVAWSGKGRVFEIRMGPSWSPLIRIFTAKRSFAWSDFLTLGFTWSEFLRIGEGYGETSYSKPAIDVYTVSAIEPYQSMDDLASGRGVMASGTSWQKVPSARSEHPSDKGFVALPPSVVSRLQAVKEPAMQPFDPSRLPLRARRRLARWPSATFGQPCSRRGSRCEGR